MRRIDAYWQRLPAWARPYFTGLAALTAGCVIAAALLHTIGTKSKPLIALMGDVIFLGSAWLGYGPGVLVLALISFVVPYILYPGQVRHVDLTQFFLLSAISLLVSRISSAKRQ